MIIQAATRKTEDERHAVSIGIYAIGFQTVSGFFQDRPGIVAGSTLIRG